MKTLSLAACSSLLVILCLLANPLLARDPVTPAVGKWLETASAGDRIAVWVFFGDKGPGSGQDVEARAARVAASFDPSAVERRLRARPDRPFGEADLPMYKPYLEALRSEGVEFRAFSKWLNGASVMATPAQVAAIARLPFVASLRRVSGSAGGPQPIVREAGTKEVGALYEYGQAWTQLNQIQVPALHSQGYTGSGVKIAIFDTGFWLDHEVFSSLNKIAEHDFINNDSVTANQPGDLSNQHNHGTMCLSLLAANRPGTMMGAAFGAQYILAKTENMASETPIEEDYWIAAAEWADSLGAQVISSSLGYTDWYTYEDMDGNTAPITIAADMAVYNGIVVVNAAGNSGAGSWKYIGAPADGDSVISVGSVDSLGTRSYWSSQGPTFDGRIKPTIMAMGQADLIATPSGVSSYSRGSGTSFATPLTAGAIALLLQKHPNWLPGNVIDAITATGTRASIPDTLYGWGILQINDASDYVPAGIAGGGSAERPSRLAVYPNPCRASFSVSVPAAGAGRAVRVFDIRGRLVAEGALSPSGTARFTLGGPGSGIAPGIVIVDVPGLGRAKVLVLK